MDKRLEEKDSIMEDDVITTINDFLKTHTGEGTSGPELVVQTLAGSYRGYAEMSKLMAGWLDSIKPENVAQDEEPLLDDTDPVATTNVKAMKPKSDDIIYTFLKNSIIQRYQPKLVR